MNNTTEELTPQLPYAVVYGCIMSIGFPLNAVAIWIFLRHHSLKSPSVVFMLNLAISDLILASSLPLKVYFHATGTWPGRHITYIGVKGFFNANIVSSAIFITFISVDRLLAVVYPLQSRHIRTARNSAKAAVLVWIFVILMTVYYVCGKYLKCLESFTLEHSHKNIKSKFAAGMFQLILVLLLLIVNVVSAVLVSVTLHRNVKDLPSYNKKANVMLLFVISLIMFTVCFVPMALGFLIKGKQKYLKCIAAANSCLDPMLYYFSLDAFWVKKEERKPGLPMRC